MRSLGTYFKRIWSKNLSFFLNSLLLFSLFLTYCSFEKPSAPSWNVDVSIPLISKVYTMAEIAEDESSILVDSTGVLNFEVEEELEGYYVGDQLTFESVEEEFELTLGTFTVDSPGSQSSSVELREILGGAEGLDGQTVVVPPFDFESQKKPYDYEGYSYVVLESGEIRFAIENDLAIPLGPPLTIELWHQVEDTLIASVSSTTRIEPGSSGAFTLDLSDTQLASQLAVRLTGSSPGSEGQPVEVDAQSTFGVSAEIADLQVVEALAEIPSQVVTNEDEVSIDDSFVIVDAKIEQGAIDISVSGELPVDTWIVYSLPDFVSHDGHALVDSFLVLQNSTATQPIDLAGYVFQPEMAQFGEQRTRFEWRARTVDTGANMVTVKSTDKFRAEVSLSNVQFSEVSGKVDGKEIDIEQQEIEFDIPADLDSIFFETARMELHLNNRINFPATINFRIEGQNEAGAVSVLDISELVQPASQPGVATESIITLDQQNSNIKEFISILPSFLSVDGRVQLGDRNWIGTVSEDDFVDGMVKISAPFAVRLPEQEVDAEIAELEIEEDVKDDIIENISTGSFYAEISNHLPLGASVEIFFSQDSSQVYDSPVLRIGPINSDPAQVAGDGLVQTAVTSDVVIELNELEMRTFLESPLYAGVRVRTSGTGNQFVRIRGSDFIQVKSYSTIKVKVNQD